MSKICIVGATNLKHMSLISLYTKYFDENNIPYDLIYLDRYDIDEENNAENVYKLNVKRDIKSKKIYKLIDFIKFRRFAAKYIKDNKYQFVITWQLTTAYILFGVLGRGHKYIVNVRDYIMENNPIIKFMLKKLVKKSFMTTVSSEGFYEFLPDYAYIKVNSINEKIISNITESDYKINDNKKYRIGFIGNCRFFDACYKLIDAFKNDERFEVWFSGTNSEILSEYAEKKGAENVFTTPGFAPDETIRIMSEFDVVNSAFGNDSTDCRLLVPIRLYTAVALLKPMLVNFETQLSKEVDAFGLGFSIRSYNNLADDLYNYLTNLDRNKFKENCDFYLEKSRRENTEFYNKLKELIAQTA